MQAARLVPHLAHSIAVVPFGVPSHVYYKTTIRNYQQYSFLYRFKGIRFEISSDRCLNEF